ncbi:MAG TPA: NUDIX domain-containing protein [Phycisphaerales bacterium]|jgi:8-oxo-dGTP diphosphatase|nr:NUDIX domain-containing protein [Phycisphaerales bacterium]HIB01570.1 NUDIX domain-containing protein [Phycisphaerales bacterium]HIB49798.1 NUDIX domain-containing protein [Phycisphaerales bacterium]HIN84739.1 NUDIX domain-containing protein [Phycisphaerales bacterium]HIO19979.1 NUDIX domain-containing protein [Phycisphaerales bacterium]
MPDNYSIADLPYKIAVLCYLYDEDGRLLLLHRNKEPNFDKYSPIGGKLEASIGESPHACAIREIHEESGVVVEPNDIRLSGMLAETAFEGATHWLIFLYEVTRTVSVSEITSMEIDEGTLEWVAIDEIMSRNIPNTDRDIIWPLVKQHRGGFFAVDIDCSKQPYTWEVKEEWKSTDV